MNCCVVVLTAVCMPVFASVADRPKSAAGNKGWAEYLKVFELFMNGGLPATRTAFVPVYI